MLHKVDQGDWTSSARSTNNRDKATAGVAKLQFEVTKKELVMGIMFEYPCALYATSRYTILGHKI